MNSFTKPILKTVFMALFLFGLQSCDNSKNRFEDPPWLGGSSIETLKEKGNYSIFLDLMEKANYTEPISKQLFTLFVPNDDAFKSYFSSIGINSVEDLSEDEAVEIFTLHVLRNSRSRFQLIYEFIWEELQGPQGEYASLFFRKPTNSTSIPYREKPRYIKGFPDSMWIYTGIKLMPLFSTDYFEDFFGDPNGSDYQFMYPGSVWPATGLCWGPAAVTEQEVRTSNGFIYFIDRVVPPQPNLEQYLRNHQDKYGVYYDLMQRFANYTNPSVSKDKRVMYNKAYTTVLNIAEEQGAFTGNELRMKDMFTLFIPPDEIMQNYLNNTVLKYYSSIDDIPQITLYYIVQTQISRSLGLISKISRNFFNSFGDPTVITKGDIVSSAMCSNGLLYETNRVLEPNVFTCVPGRLFFDKNYSTFLYIVNSSNLLSTLTNPDQNVTLFAPSNEQIDAYGIRYDKQLDKIVQLIDNTWKDMKEEDLTMFVQDHIYTGKITDLSGEGYIEMNSKNYIHFMNNKIGGGVNVLTGKEANVLEKNENSRNGMLYILDEPIMTNLKMGDFIYNQPELSDFSELLVKAQLLDPNYVDMTTLDTVPNLKFLGEAYYWTAFIPTNTAMANARSAGLVPDESDIDALKNFLLYHFIRKSTIFDDGRISGEFPTNFIEGKTSAGPKYATLTISNSSGNLDLTDHSGAKISVNHSDADALVRYGVVHKINTVLKY
jgi:uncharacterized surface protein with fasciclin (FAS1) repeats